MTKQSLFQPFLDQQGFILLDGGLATELERRGGAESGDAPESLVWLAPSARELCRTWLRKPPEYREFI